MRSIEEKLARLDGRGYVIAPAGYGKTHLIARSVGLCDTRQLILTHTYAGVAAISNTLRRLGVPRDLFQVETIASWALRLCVSYRNTSGWAVEKPTSGDWNDLYGACAALLKENFIKRVLRASYGGVFVDEYQDCSAAQHAVVMKLTEVMPCRILGDYMQGLFDFNDSPVSWTGDVENNFENLGELTVPHRWLRTGQRQLGEWLSESRAALERGLPIDGAQRTPGLTFIHVSDSTQRHTQINTCKHFRSKPGETVVGIHKGDQAYKSKCHALARQLGGSYSSVEEIEGKVLLTAIRDIGRAKTSNAALIRLTAFAEKCITGVKAGLPASVKRGEYSEIRSSTKNPHIARAANSFLQSPNPSAMLQFLNALKETPSASIFRADLYYRMCGVLRKNTIRQELTLEDAANEYQMEFRRRGRPIMRSRLLGTTLLLKGLEFDHAIVLDASSLGTKELYVAITRGSRSLTIIGHTPALCPG